MDDGFSLALCLYQPYLEITPQTGEQITPQLVEQKGNAITPQLLQQVAAKLFCALGASYAAMMLWLTYGFLAFLPWNANRLTTECIHAYLIHLQPS